MIPVMPKVKVGDKVGDIEIYYEIHGEGEPLILIGGLSNDITDYTEKTNIVALLAKHYKVVAFDNRGVGRTDKPDIPYTLEMMTEDTAGLLKALDIESTHVIGISLGGRIALQFTLAHPDMVEKLVLVSTGPCVVKSWKRSLLFTFSRLPIFKNKKSQPDYAFKRQREASSSYDYTDRLREIRVPTLILHGKKDGVAPYSLAEDMHNRIPNSKFIAFNGGHVFFFFQSQQFVDTVIDFLR